MKPDVYFSIDAETDGPIPGDNSMLSLGCAAFDNDGKMIGTFSANFEEIIGAKQNPQTMEWWAKNIEAWKACRANPEVPHRAMHTFNDWVEQFKAIGRPVCIAYPAGFDFMFVYWYLMHYLGQSPFSFSALDIKTLAYAAMGAESYNQATKHNWPRDWFTNRPHTHVALDDAIGQGESFFQIRRALQK